MFCSVFVTVFLAVQEINEAISSNNEETLSTALSNKEAGLSGVVKENISWYMKMLGEKKKINQEVC